MERRSRAERSPNQRASFQFDRRLDGRNERLSRCLCVRLRARTSKRRVTACTARCTFNQAAGDSIRSACKLKQSSLRLFAFANKLFDLTAEGVNLSWFVQVFVALGLLFLIFSLVTNLQIILGVNHLKYRRYYQDGERKVVNLHAFIIFAQKNDPLTALFIISDLFL